MSLGISGIKYRKNIARSDFWWLTSEQSRLNRRGPIKNSIIAEPKNLEIPNTYYPNPVKFRRANKLRPKLFRKYSHRRLTIIHPVALCRITTIIWKKIKIKILNEWYEISKCLNLSGLLMISTIRL